MLPAPAGRLDPCRADAGLRSCSSWISFRVKPDRLAEAVRRFARHVDVVDAY
jgi:hypothetical protein